MYKYGTSQPLVTGISVKHNNGVRLSFSLKREKVHRIYSLGNAVWKDHHPNLENEHPNHSHFRNCRGFSPRFSFSVKGELVYCYHGNHLLYLHNWESEFMKKKYHNGNNANINQSWS